MNSYSHGESIPHKRSNFSSFASQKINDKIHMEQQSYSPQPLQYHDIIILLHSERFMLGLADITQLSPGIINVNQSKNFVFGMMEILPVGSGEHENIIKTGQKFCLKNYQSNLYLCAQDELLQKFTNIIFKQELNSHCEFTFERTVDNNDKTIYNRETLKIKNVVSRLYIHIEQENQELNRFKHLWLSQLSDDFKVVVLNRQEIYQEFLNNNDIILLSADIKCQKRYIGISKHKTIYDYSEKKENIMFDVNHFYYEKDNCEIQYYNEEDGRKRYLVPCLWRVIKNSFTHDLTYLIKNKEEVYLQHLETGLYLLIDSNNCLGLDNHEYGIKIENLHKFKTEFSINNKFQPIYIKHAVSITSPITQKNYYIQRIKGKNYVILYFSQILHFFDNLIKTMINPKLLNQNRQQLIKQSKLYVFIYQEIQAHIEQFEDQGFYFFQYTLRILQLLKIVLKDEKANFIGSEMAVRRSLLNPLITQIIKFISLIVITSETFQKITTEDNKKTKEIIHIIFILYNFNFKYTLNLMVTLASTHPDLVVRLLSEKIYKAEHFEERVQLIESINQIIDQFRRINFDEENLKGILEKQHKLIIHQNCIYISFQRKQHSIFDLFQSISKFQNNIESKDKEERQTYYFFYYLLSIIKILFNNISEQFVENQFASKENHFNCRSLVQKLSEEYEKNQNINAKMIILELIYEIISEMYHKEFITFTKLNFIIYNGEKLQEKTPLAQILKIPQETTLEWIFSKQQIITVMQEILSFEWQKNYSLMLKLKYFSKVVNYLTAVIITATYDLQTLNLIEQFCIYLATIFYRKRTSIDFFKQMRFEINAYQQKMSYLIVDGVKIYLDNLMVKLTMFFDAIFTQKKRLYIYPIYDNRQKLFRFRHFQENYTQLIMNKRIRIEIKSMQSLLKLNQEKLQVNGFILNGGKDYSDAFKMIEKIIEDLDCLAIIMESFRLYGQDMELKENIVASMKLKILNIEDLLKNVCKNKYFHICSDSFNLSSHLFQFVLENSFEHELILPLLQGLEERITHNNSIFKLLQENMMEFFDVILDSSNSKNSKMILKWVGKQIQHIPAPINIKEYEFIYTEVVRLIQDDFTINLLYLVNILKEIGLNHPIQEEILYSKLINLPHIQDFITNCNSLKTFKLTHERLEKDHEYFYRQYETSLQLITIFRICSTYPHLMSHLSNLLPYKEIRQGMQDHQQYFLYKPLVSFIVNEIKGEVDIDLINLEIIFIAEHLSEFKKFIAELPKYKVRDNLWRDRDGKAHTHFCRTFSMAINNNAKNIPNENEERKRYYWQFLMWIPFYRQPQGLLKNLKEIIMLIIEKVNHHENIEYNLQKIQKYLIEIKSYDVINFQQQKQFIKKINNILNLIKIYQNRKKKTRKSKTQIIKTDQFIEEIYKTLLENQLMKPFLCSIVHPVIKESSFAQRRASDSLYSSTHSFRFKPQEEEYILDESENATLREKSHHSLITPSSSKFDRQTKYVTEQIKFNIFEFFKKLKSIIPYKIRLYSKLQYSLLQYFQRDGSLVMLQYKLNQQINNHRNLATEYRSQDVQYQIERKTIKAQFTDFFTNEMDLSKIRFGIERIDISKFEELIQVNQLKILSLIFKEIAYKKESEKNKLIIPSIPELQSLLLVMLRLINTSGYDLFQILQCCNNLLQIMIRYCGEDRQICENYKLDLYTCFSFFIYELINTRNISDNNELYFKTIIFSCKLEFIYLRCFNSQLEMYIIKQLLAKLPSCLFYHARCQITQMQIQMLNNTTKIFHIEQFALFLQFMGAEMHKLIPEYFLSENMEFYENIKLINATLDMLQLYLRKILIPKEFDFPAGILKAFINLQHLIFLNFFSQYGQLDSKDRFELYESLVIEILSFFYTMNLRKVEQIDASSLYLQRNSFINELQFNNSSKQIYEFYDDTFQFCVLYCQNRVPIVQAYPRDCNKMTWKAQFHKILSSYSDLDDKKDIIFSYAALAVEQEKDQLKYENYCHQIQPTIIIISTAILSLCIIERLVINCPNVLTIWFQLLMCINLFLLIFTILERVMMIRKVLKLQIKIGRCENWLAFMLKSKKFFVCLTIFLTFINIYSIFYPNYMSILYFIHFYSKRSLSDYESSAIIYNIKIVLGIILISFSAAFLFAFSIHPDHTLSLFPLYNLQMNYNIDYMAAFVHIWQDNFSSSPKIFYFLTIIMGLTYVFIAIIVFYYLENNIKQNQEIKKCLLCDGNDTLKTSKSYAHIINHHIDFDHNIFKFISVFKYILKKQEIFLSLQEKQLKKMIIDKNKFIFK